MSDLGHRRYGLCRWVLEYEAELGGQVPPGKAMTPEQKRVQILEAQVKRLEMEKAILKKRPPLGGSHPVRNA